MDGVLGRYAPHLYATLRIVAGIMFAMHGIQKLFGWPGDNPPVEIASMMGLAGIIELVAGIMIAIGFMTGWAALVAAVLMLVAYLMAHAGQGALPIVNQGELAILYCFVFLYMAAQGSGIWSVDGSRRVGTRAAFTR